MYKKVMAFLMIFSLLILCACGQAEQQETSAESTEEIQDSSMLSDNEAFSSQDEQEPTIYEDETTTDHQTATDESGQNTSAQESQGETALEPADTYEEHLAALTIFALSMEYPDFVLEGIYTSSAVAIEQKGNSEGIYAVFESYGEKYIMHVYPIDEERSEAMTRDLYAAELGYAAFDEVEKLPDGIAMLDEDVFTQLLKSLSGVSVFTH